MVVHRSASRDDGREKRRLVPRCDLADDLRLTIVGPLSGVVMTGCLSSCGLLIGRRALPQRLLLQLVELGLAYCPTVEQLLSCRDLTSRVVDLHDGRGHVRLFVSSPAA